nr:RNA polymerase sigma factor [Alteromonas pelagimontana]
MTLIQAAQLGDKHAYRSLYEQYVGRVYALCYRLTGDRSLAEDATQEVFIQLWRKLDNYNQQSKFTTWLHSVTANVTISYMRRQKGWFKRIFSIDDNPVEHEETSASSDSVDLESLILRLPERARMVFVLHAIEGYRHEDIAQMLNMAVGSSKAQFHRAKQLMKSWMGYENQ